MPDQHLVNSTFQMFPPLAFWYSRLPPTHWHKLQRWQTVKAGQTDSLAPQTSRENKHFMNQACAASELPKDMNSIGSAAATEPVLEISVAYKSRTQATFRKHECGVDNERPSQPCASWCLRCASARKPAVQAPCSIRKHALAGIGENAPSGGPTGSHHASIHVLTVQS